MYQRPILKPGMPLYVVLMTIVKIAKGEQYGHASYGSRQYAPNA